MKKWEKDRLILLVKKAVRHAIYTKGYYDEDESSTLELLEKWEKEDA
jgi:hypothetical protein